MAKTRQPVVFDVPYRRASQTLIAIQCPGCLATVPLGLRPMYRDGYDVLPDGSVYPAVVCHNRHADGSYCEFSAPVRLRGKPLGRM